MRVILTFDEEAAPCIEIHDGNVKRKGYFDPYHGPEILEEVYTSIFRGKKELSGRKRSNGFVGWNIFKENVLAMDMRSESIVVKIPSQLYYMPFVNGDTKAVFKIMLPHIIGIKNNNTVSLFCTNENFNKIDLETEVYVLNIPHSSNAGVVCKGSYKGNFDINNPSKYFVDLILFPNSHQNEVNRLRELEKKGYEITKDLKGIKINKLL